LRIDLFPTENLLALNIKLGTTNPILKNIYFILGLYYVDLKFSYFLFTALNLNFPYHDLHFLLMIKLTSIIIALNFIFEKLVKIILEFVELILPLLFHLFQFFYIFIAPQPLKLLLQLSIDCFGPVIELFGN